LVYAHNGHLQRNKSRMRMGDLPLEWWSAGAIVSAHLGDGYAFLATALGTIRHDGVDTPPPDTIEGLLYALPEDRYVVERPPTGHRPRRRDARSPRVPLPRLLPARPSPLASNDESCSSRTPRRASLLSVQRSNHRQRDRHDTRRGFL
jgi:hypothetical protein